MGTIYLLLLILGFISFVIGAWRTRHGLNAPWSGVFWACVGLAFWILVPVLQGLDGALGK